MTLTWSNNYSVNIESVDDQHKKFFSIFNKADALISEPIAPSYGEKMDSIFKDLEDYAKFHFSYEEELFDKFNYEDKATHKNEHDKFKDELANLRIRFDNGEKDIVFSVISFLEKWLTEHISYTDKKYSSFLKNKGVN